MTKVLLNVYDLIPDESKGKEVGKDVLTFIGMGLFHSGVEVYGREISFGMDFTGRNDPTTDGVFIVRPRTAVGTFKETIDLGEINLSERAVEDVLNSIRPDWRAASYHILGHNCNCFTKAFVAALNPSGIANYPSWLNRAATTGNVVIPNALLNRITEAVSPPMAIPPDLVNKIHFPVSGSVPRALPPQKFEQPAKPSGGLLGLAKGVVSKVEGLIAPKVSDAERKDFDKEFPTLVTQQQAQLLAAYTVKVIHINRMQTAKMYICDKGVAFSGKNKLYLLLGYKDFVSIQYGKTIDPPKEQMNLPPTFQVASSLKEANAILFYMKMGVSTVMVPVYDVTTFGAVYDHTLGKIASADPLENAMKFIDTEWRKNVKV